MKKICALILLFAMAFVLAAPAAAVTEEAVGTTLRLTETKGTVEVKDASGKKKALVKTGTRLYNNYTVKTGAESSAYIQLDDAKAVQLDANTTVTIQKSGKKLEVALQGDQGQIFFNVTSKLKKDESFTIRNANTITGVRGTAGIITDKLVAILEGKVTVTFVDGSNSNSSDNAERTAQVAVAAGQMLDIIEALTASESAQGGESAVQTLTADNIPAMVVEAMMDSPTLAEAVLEAIPTLDVQALYESLPEKQAAEAAAQKQAQAKADANAQAQQTQIESFNKADGTSGVVSDASVFNEIAAATPGATATPETKTAESKSDDSDSSSSSSGSGSGSSGSYTPPAHVTTRITLANTTATELNDYLTRYDVVTVTGGSLADAPVTVPQDTELIVWGSSAAGTAGGIDSITSLTVKPKAKLTLAGGRLTLHGATVEERGTISTSAQSFLLFGNGGAVMNRGTINAAGDVDNSATLLSNKGTFTAQKYLDNHSNFSNSETFSAYAVINDVTVTNYGTFRVTDGFVNKGTYYNYGGSCQAAFLPETQGGAVYTYELTLRGINGDANRSVMLMANSKNAQVSLYVANYTNDSSGEKTFDTWKDGQNNSVGMTSEGCLNMTASGGAANKVTATYTAAWTLPTATVTVAFSGGSMPEYYTGFTVSQNGTALSANSNGSYEVRRNTDYTVALTFDATNYMMETGGRITALAGGTNAAFSGGTNGVYTLTRQATGATDTVAIDRCDAAYKKATATTLGGLLSDTNMKRIAIDAGSGSVSSGGAYTIASDVTVWVCSGTLSVEGTLDVCGTLKSDSGTINVTSGATLASQSGGSITLGANGKLINNGGTFVNAGTLTNAGTITGNGVFRNKKTFTNSGTMDIASTLEHYGNRDSIVLAENNPSINFGTATSVTNEGAAINSTGTIKCGALCHYAPTNP